MQRIRNCFATVSVLFTSSVLHRFPLGPNTSAEHIGFDVRILWAVHMFCTSISRAFGAFEGVLAVLGLCLPSYAAPSQTASFWGVFLHSQEAATQC